MRTTVVVLLAAAMAASCFLSAGTGRGNAWSAGDRDAPAFDRKDDALTVKDLLAAGAARTAPTAEERKLVDLINAHRAGRGLPAIPLSRSLTFVAKLHVRDLAAHPVKEPCNCHSWSADGPWTGGCYTPDHKAAAMMWNKPRELTAYPGSGFEISRGAWYATAYLGAADSLEGWKASAPHHAVIVNEGTWKDVHWRAIGAGIFRNYAVVWFGKDDDPEK